MGGRILIGAPGSGSGKTLITCGLLTALKQRGLSCRSYKCGPDYIDPMFHRWVLGIPSGNLDSYFSGPDAIRSRLREETAEADMTVVEGVMGYYDGLGGDSVQASAYHIASITETPAVLVVNGRGAGLSLAALVKGFREFRPDSRIAGVIVNRTSPKMAERLRKPIEETGAAFLGCLPEIPDIELKSRHLGLVMPEETERLREIFARTAEEMEAHLDLDRLLSLAGTCPDLAGTCPDLAGICPDLSGTSPSPVAPSLSPAAPSAGLAEAGLGFPEGDGTDPVTVAVARDEAFCFYYEENLRLLEKMGARLVEFSPLRDPCPPEADGLLLGGGYPELYGRELEGNRPMRESIRALAEAGLPVMAECGGFMYLKEELEGADGRMYAMAGFLPGSCKNAGRLTRFGYLELSGLPEGPVRGHEFHYWDCTENGELCLARKPSGGRSWRCMERKKGVTAGFPHLYYPSNPGVPGAFLEKCRVFREERPHD